MEHPSPTTPVPTQALVRDALAEIAAAVEDALYLLRSNPGSRPAIRKAEAHIERARALMSEM